MASYKELYAAWYVWRPAHPKKRKGSRGDKGVAAALLAMPFLPTARQTEEQFARLERRAPQVMVKVTRPTFGAAHTFANMTYIARNCEEQIFDQDGCLYVDNAELERLADDWHQQNQDAYDGERRYRGPDARRLQFSMPKGTDPVALRNAVSATARHVLGDRFDYVYALHTDRPHPHVHLTVRAVSHEGRALRINKDDLLYFRRTMALELRMRGIEADATPQIARRARVKHERTEVHRANQRRASTQALRGEPAAPPAPSEPADPYVLRVYEAAANRLRASGHGDDLALAERIEQFAIVSRAGNRQRADPKGKHEPVSDPVGGRPRGPKPRL